MKLRSDPRRLKQEKENKGMRRGNETMKVKWNNES
jgi:hypothetical protein